MAINEPKRKIKRIKDMNNYSFNLNVYPLKASKQFNK